MLWKLPWPLADALADRILAHRGPPHIPLRDLLRGVEFEVGGPDERAGVCMACEKPDPPESFPRIAEAFCNCCGPARRGDLVRIEALERAAEEFLQGVHDAVNTRDGWEAMFASRDRLRGLLVGLRGAEEQRGGPS